MRKSHTVEGLRAQRANLLSPSEERMVLQGPSPKPRVTRAFHTGTTSPQAEGETPTTDLPKNSQQLRKRKRRRAPTRGNQRKDLTLLSGQKRSKSLADTDRGVHRRSIRDVLPEEEKGKLRMNSASRLGGDANAQKDYDEGGKQASVRRRRRKKTGSKTTEGALGDDEDMTLEGIHGCSQAVPTECCHQRRDELPHWQEAGAGDIVSVELRRRANFDQSPIPSNAMDSSSVGFQPSTHARREQDKGMPPDYEHHDAHHGSPTLDGRKYAEEASPEKGKTPSLDYEKGEKGGGGGQRSDWKQAVGSRTQLSYGSDGAEHHGRSLSSPAAVNREKARTPEVVDRSRIGGGSSLDWVGARSWRTARSPSPGGSAPTHLPALSNPSQTSVGGSPLDNLRREGQDWQGQDGLFEMAKRSAPLFAQGQGHYGATSSRSISPLPALWGAEENVSEEWRRWEVLTDAMTRKRKDGQEPPGNVSPDRELYRRRWRGSSWKDGATRAFRSLTPG